MERDFEQDLLAAPRCAVAREFVTFVLWTFRLIPFLLTTLWFQWIESGRLVSLLSISRFSWKFSKKVVREAKESLILHLYNVKYGPRPRNHADIFVPTTLNLDITSSKTKLMPIWIFCHGGAWFCGDKNTHSLSGREMAKYGVVSIIPNYTLHPNGTIDHMMEDLSFLLRFVTAHSHEWNADSMRIYLCGHSAGAHIPALLILRFARYLNLLKYSLNSPLSIPSISPFEPESDTSSIPPHLLPLYYAPYFPTSITAEDDTMFKDAGWSLKSIVGFIGISGVYSILDHHRHEIRRGVQHRSPMLQTMKHQYLFHSPTQLLNCLSGSILGHTHFLLIHGSEDRTVPLTSTTIFQRELRKKVRKKGIASSTLHVLPRVTHCEMVLPVNSNEKKIFLQSYQLIQKFVKRVEGNFIKRLPMKLGMHR